MFPFFPFGPIPAFFAPPVFAPTAFMAPVMAPFASLFPGFFPDAMTTDRPSESGENGDDGPVAGLHPAQAMMSLALMPFAAPMALSAQMAQAMRDAGTVAREMQEALERDGGPVEVMIGDPHGPSGLAIGITLYRRSESPALRTVQDVGAPALAPPSPSEPGQTPD